MNFERTIPTNYQIVYTKSCMDGSLLYAIKEACRTTSVWPEFEWRFIIEADKIKTFNSINNARDYITSLIAERSNPSESIWKLIEVYKVHY